MLRRSRFSVRPNVGTSGRTAATPQEVPAANQEAHRVVTEGISGTAGADNKSVVTPSEKPTGQGDASDQNGEGSSSSAAVQRRKRFSVKPKVAPGRPATLARTPKSPVKAVTETPVEVPGSDKPAASKPAASKPAASKPAASSQTGPPGLQSPKQRRPSDDTKQTKVQPKPSLVTSDSSAPSAVPSAEDSQEQTCPPADSGKQLQSTSSSQVKEVPPRPPDRVLPCIPDKESTELSERAKTLVTFKSGLSLSPSALSLSRLLNDPSDLQRLAKAKKLRELLREEKYKDKKLKKAMARVKEYTIDPAKMTMRDLIRYLPLSNPMASSLEESTQENETVMPTSPETQERSPERAKEPEVLPDTTNPSREVNEEEEDEDEEQEDALMVPQVKVAEDGSLIIDEESLTVEVQRAKGPNPAQDKDPIFERGSTTTYSSFRKGTCPKPWSSEETDMFFLAVSMVGTDFSMISQLFPHRARAEIKNKFKKEDRENAWRIDKAFRERRKLDIEYFSKLLEKILEVQKNKKKLKSLSEKNSTKKKKRKKKGKRAAEKLSDVEEEDGENENEVSDLDEEEGEKENEHLCKEATAPKPKRQQKRKSRLDVSNKEPNNKKNKTSEISSEHAEPCLPEDTEASLPQDSTNSDICEKAENADASNVTIVKPAKLSRGRAPKPVLPLGRRFGKKAPPPSTKAKGAEAEGVTDKASNEQINIDASPSRDDSKGISANDDVSSDEEDVVVPPQRPTRYGRVPKPTKPLTYPAKEDAHSSASETTPASPVRNTTSAAKPKPKCPGKRGRSSVTESGQESKKPKLITLRASQSDYGDDENEQQSEQEELEEEEHLANSPSKDSIAPVFVPASLRSPRPVISVVEETMEELDILASMPDVLGISQDAMCPDASCEQAQNEMGTAEPCEHQLDLLVDVIDFLSGEQTDESEDESYNEAAQTLLTIGNFAQHSQTAQNQIATQDHTKGTTSNTGTSQHLQDEIQSNPLTPEQSSQCAEAFLHGVTETSGADASVELLHITADSGDMPITEVCVHICSEQMADMDHIPQLQSSPESSTNSCIKTRRENIYTVTPKLGHGQPSSTEQPKSQPEPPAAIESVGVPEEAVPKISECITALEEDISSAQVKLTEETSSSQECIHINVESVTGNQSYSFFDAQYEPVLDHASQETGSVSSYRDEKLMLNFEITKMGSNRPATSDVSITELQIEQDHNTDSVPCHEDSHRTAAVTLVEDLPAGQTAESEVASTCQSRRSRLQKLKPKPNLLQSSRTARSKAQITKKATEQQSSPNPNPVFHEKSAKVELEQTCATPDKTTQSTSPASTFTQSQVLGSTLTSTEELSTAEEGNTDVSHFSYVETGEATSGQSTAGNQYSSGDRFQFSWEQARTFTESVSESTDEKLLSHSEIHNIDCNSPITEPQIEQELKADSVPGHTNSHTAAFVTPEKDLLVSQKAESEVASTYQSKRNRLQKFKPKPNLSQTSRTTRSKLQVTKESTEKDFTEEGTSPTTIDSFHETLLQEVEPEPCAIPPEITHPTTVCPSILIPSLDLGSTPTPTEQFSAAEVKDKQIGQVDQSIVQSASENQSLTLSSDSNVGQRTNEPDKEDSSHSSAFVTPIETLPVGQKEKFEITSMSQSRKCRLQKVKPTTDLQTAGTASFKPQTTEDSTKHMPFVEKPSSSAQSLEYCTTQPTEELSSTEEQKTDVGVVLDSSSENSEPNPPQRRRRFPKVKPKPNLASSTRTTREKYEPQNINELAEQHINTSSAVRTVQQDVDKNREQTKVELIEKNNEHLASVHLLLNTELVSSNKSAVSLSGTSLDSTNDMATCSDGIVTKTSLIADSLSVLTTSVNISDEKSTGGKMSRKSTVKGEQRDCKLDVSSRVTELNTQGTNDPTVILDAQAPEGGSTESERNSALTNAYSIPDPKESSLQSCPESDLKERSQESSLSALGTDESQSMPAESSQPTRKGPPARRSRLCKPKPNLGCRSKTPQPQQVQNATRADSGTCSQNMNYPVLLKPVIKLQRVEEQVVRPTGQKSSHNSPSDVTGSPLDRLTHGIEQLGPHESPLNVAGSSLGPSTQDTSNREWTQSQTRTVFPDMLSEQLPSDPDEPFFILSLTEIPICSSGDVADSAAECVSYQHLTDASIQQQSCVPEDTLSDAGHGSVNKVPVPVSTKESGEVSHINVKDTKLEPSTHIDSAMKNPVDEHVESSGYSESVEENDDTEIPPSKQRLKGTGRRAKLQANLLLTKKNQATKTLATNTTQEAHQTTVSGAKTEADSEIITETQEGSGHQVETSVKDSSLESPCGTLKTRLTSSRSRNPKATAKSSKVKTSHASGKRSSASSRDLAPSVKPDEACSTFPTTSKTQTESVEQTANDGQPSPGPPSQCPFEVSASQQSDYVESSFMEEEPISVSHYFLSDIFTEVEEG